MRKTCFVLAFFIVFIFSCKKDNTKKEPETKKKSEFQEIANVSFNNTSINTIVVDGSGIIWVGTGSGLYLFNNNKWYLSSTLNGKAINSIKVHNSEVLVAASNGAYSYNYSNDTISITDSIRNTVIGAASKSMSVYGFGIFDKKWIGSPDGLAYFDGTTWKMNQEIKNNLGGISDVNSIAFRDTDCFFGTNGKFLYHLWYNHTKSIDAITGASQMIGGAPNPVNNFNGELTTDTIYCVFAGSDTSIWFGSNTGLTRNKGGTSSQNGHGVFEYFLRGERVYSVIEASDKKIWAGTETGLSVKTTTDWTTYNISNGLPGNQIYCIAEDKDLSVWIGTNKGVSHFANGSFINY